LGGVGEGSVEQSGGRGEKRNKLNNRQLKSHSDNIFVESMHTNPKTAEKGSKKSIHKIEKAKHGAKHHRIGAREKQKGTWHVVKSIELC